MKTRFFIFFLVCGITFSESALYALNETRIYAVQGERVAPRKYEISGIIKNNTAQAREVTLRLQITVYDRAVPEGDIPLLVLQKDMTKIISANASAKVEASFVHEGSEPTGLTRLEPSIRIRRDREWLY